MEQGASKSRAGTSWPLGDFVGCFTFGNYAVSSG